MLRDLLFLPKVDVPFMPPKPGSDIGVKVIYLQMLPPVQLSSIHGYFFTLNLFSSFL